MSINFCHISPTPHLSQLTAFNGSHLLLAHLIEEDPHYQEFYAKLDDGREKIMDNSGFEMFKMGREMYNPSKLVQMAASVHADIIVLPDYPMQPAHVTMDAAAKMLPVFKDNGFGAFYVPQSEVGDLEGYLTSMNWALNNPDIKVIGLSILGCPIALGMKEQKFDSLDQIDGAYKMQRFLSRWKILSIMKERGMLDERAVKKFHCLGLVDGPNEIDLLQEFVPYIRSWDTSSAVWLGLSGNMTYDSSPTGLRNGKYEKEVDFDFSTSDADRINKAISNIEFINSKPGITKL